MDATTVDSSRVGDLRFALLNSWQRDFPLVETPFAAIARACGAETAQVVDGYRQLLQDGAISRLGGVWAAGAGGAAMLCAFAVAPARLEAVAALVSAHPGVNHNYEREHRYNLWFVITGPDRPTINDAVAELEAQTGCQALRLRMERAYRIDLGFDLRQELAAHGPVAQQQITPVADADRALAALVEEGLPLVERPFDSWAQALQRPVVDVLACLQAWLDAGTLRRFGAVVRHHEAGYAQNAMTVFAVPDEIVDHCGELLAVQRGVTLAYRRERAADWPYNLYCMVHGRDRASVLGALEQAKAQAGLESYPSAVLFSRRRFKQVGARYFRALPVGAAHAV